MAVLERLGPGSEVGPGRQAGIEIELVFCSPLLRAHYIVLALCTGLFLPAHLVDDQLRLRQELVGGCRRLAPKRTSTSSVSLVALVEAREAGVEGGLQLLRRDG